MRLSVLSLRKHSPPSARGKNETIRKGCVRTIASSPFMLPPSPALPGPLISAWKLMTFFSPDNRLAAAHRLAPLLRRRPFAEPTRVDSCCNDLLYRGEQQQRRSRLFSPRSRLGRRCLAAESLLCRLSVEFGMRRQRRVAAPQSQKWCHGRR